MKKTLTIAGLSLLASSTALAVPEAGTTMMGAAGGIHVTPGDMMVVLGASYGQFQDGGLFLGGGAATMLMPDFALTVDLTAQKWMEMGMFDAFAGVDVTLPVMPDFGYDVNIDVGIAKWYSDNFAITVTNVLGGLLAGEISDDIVFGTVATF